MPPGSMREHQSEVHRHKSFRRVCRADLVDDGGRLADLDRVASRRGAVRLAAACLAPVAIPVRGLCDRALVYCLHRGTFEAREWLTSNSGPIPPIRRTT